MDTERLEQEILRLLSERRDGVTMCPSEAARAVGGENWRELMEESRKAAAALEREGRIEVLQRAAGPRAFRARPDPAASAPQRSATRARRRISRAISGP